MTREDTKRLNIGSVPVGGGAAVTVQSMCNTKTEDVEATLSQLEALKAAGCDIARLAVPHKNAARALPELCRYSPLPLVADIHFDYTLALAAADAGISAIRINPGNIGASERVRAVADACTDKRIPIRIGVNGGSLEKELLQKYGGPTPEAMCESALGHVRLLNDCGFDDVCISLKASDVFTTVAAYRLMAQETNYPLHLGITETGTAYAGLIKSAAGIGALLLDGIGDTIRVSLTADPVEEVRAGIEILKAVGLRREGVNIISCPTCGRTNIDLVSMANEAERLLAPCKKTLTVAVMGCVVNGPGEASRADYGLAGGMGEGVLFKKGEIVGKAPENELLPALIRMIETEEGVKIL